MAEESPSIETKLDAPIPIRGHTLLCLHGFRGEGYSPGFVSHMDTIHTRLMKQPYTQIYLLASPDTFCHVCPNLKPNLPDPENEHTSSGWGCHLKGSASEAEIVKQDRDVLERLGLRAGDLVTWQEIQSRIAKKIRGEMLTKICGTCPWLPLGYCREGIDRLKESKRNA